MNKAGGSAAYFLREGWFPVSLTLLVKERCADQKHPNADSQAPPQTSWTWTCILNLVSRRFTCLEKRFPKCPVETCSCGWRLNSDRILPGPEAPLAILRALTPSCYPGGSGSVPACLPGMDSWARTHWHDLVYLLGEVKITFPGLPA